MDNKIVFDFFKNIIVEQNKVFLVQVAKKLNIPEQELLETYLKPEYYLPIVEKCKAKEASS
jgi:hypothetical protein